AGRRGAREGLSAPPPGANLPGARRGGRPGSHPRLGGGSRARPASRPRAGGVGGVSLRLRQPARPPERPGPGEMPEALLRALDLRVRRRMDGMLAGGYRSRLLGAGTELAPGGPDLPGDDVQFIDWKLATATPKPQVPR